MGARTVATAGALILSVLFAACDGTSNPPGTATSLGTPVASSTALTGASAGAATSVPAPPITLQATAHVTSSAVPAAEPDTESEAASVWLSPGEQASFAEWTVTFIKVTADSRCPVDVVCVWAGEVVLALAVRDPAGSAVTREVRFQGAPVEVPLQAGFSLHIEQVEPAPRSTSEIATDDYIVRARFSPLP